MNIQEQLKHAFLLRDILFHERSDHFNFSEADLQAFGVIVSEEVAIHIFTLRVAAVVTTNHSVRVDDGRDPELKHVAQLVANHFTRDQKVDEAVDDERRVGLATVLSANDHDDRLRFSILALVRYFDQWHVEVSVRGADAFKFHELVV